MAAVLPATANFTPATACCPNACPAGPETGNSSRIQDWVRRSRAGGAAALAILDTVRFADFYRLYLSEHAHPANRRMHFIGTCGALAALIAAAALMNPWLILLGIMFGYGCAWFGHFHFEKNSPATFRHPFYSFLGDWVMFRDILLGRLSIKE